MKREKKLTYEKGKLTYETGKITYETGKTELWKTVLSKHDY